MEIKINHLPNYIKAVVGLLPQDISPKELQVLTAIYYILTLYEDKTVNRKVKEDLANMSNYKLQVVTNYVNKLKKKGIIGKDSKLHPYFQSTTITFNYGA
jgi:DNA-binding MarR family transcriptional regulator